MIQCIKRDEFSYSMYVDLILIKIKVLINSVLFYIKYEISVVKCNSMC